MYYIDIIGDGEYAAGPESSEDENVAWDEFSEMEEEARAMSLEYPDTELSVRMYDDNDDIIASTVYVDGKRIA